jgi:hypothetical protein
MYDDLYEYLVLHKQLNLPGVGMLSLERKPASTEFKHKQLIPASYSIKLEHGNPNPARKLFNWLADKLNISDHEAIVKFNSFVIDLRNQVMSGNRVVWQRVGTFSKGMSGEIRFETELKDHCYDRPVSAVRVIREKAVHTVRVGEVERTSEEMAQWLNPEESKRPRWWIAALIAGVLLIIIIVIYLSKGIFNLSAVGNQQKLSPASATETYR